MPPVIVFAVAAATFLALVRAMRGIDDAPTRFLFIAFWLRFVISAFAEFSVRPVGPVSVNAVVSIILTGSALVLLGPRLLTLRRLLPLYGAIALIAASGVVNGVVMGTIEFVTRYLYLTGLSLLVYRGVSLYGLNRVMTGLLIASTVPLILQAGSIFLGVARATEADGSVSFVGGYGHEAQFSVIALGFVVVVGLMRWRSNWIGFALIVYGIVAILFANYRTTVLSALPILAASGLGAVVGTFGRRALWPTVALSLAGAAILVILAPVILPPRFVDLLRMFTDTELYTQDPDHFSRDDRRILSGRLQLWLYYIEAWREADLPQMIIGYGPESWLRAFPIYAHNTFVSWLFEFGVLGLITISILLFGALLAAARVPDPELALMLSMSAIGFIVLNLATMPMWNIEGLNIFSVLLGVTWAASRRPERSADRPPPRGQAPLALNPAE